jgi:uncharacterized protein YqeY
MSILNTIKNDNVTARKSRDIITSSLLSTLYAEAVNVGKNDGNRETSDKETLAVIKKFIDGVNFTIDNIDSVISDVKYEIAVKEREILSAYIEKFQPKQLTTEELTDIISGIVATLQEKSPKQMGLVMKSLKDSYDGMYQGNEASKIVKAVLSS